MNKLKEIYFRDFIKLNRGFDLPEDKIVPGQYPIAASTSIKDYHHKYKLKPPCVTTGRSGSLGKVLYIDTECFPLNTTLYVKDYRGNYPKYVFYFLQMMHLENFNSGAGVPTLNQNHLHSLKIKVHEIEKQPFIASILSAYDDLIENNNQRIAILENMAEQIYKEWFVRMRFPGYEQAEFEKGVPKGWNLTVFTDVIDVLSGGTPKTTKSEFWNGEIFWFAPTDIKNSFYVLKTEKKITESGLNHCNSKLFPENTIFITARGTVGNCVLTAVPMAMNQTNYAIICKSEYGLSQFYTYFLLLDLVDGFKKGANGAVFDTIIIATFERTKFILPDKKLLKEFSDIVSPMLLQIKNLLQQNELLKQTRDMLLPRLISGKLRVKDIPVPEQV